MFIETGFKLFLFLNKTMDTFEQTCNINYFCFAPTKFVREEIIRTRHEVPKRFYALRSKKKSAEPECQKQMQKNPQYFC